MYKDTVLGQMASSEKAEVWSPESYWIKQLERCAVKPWRQEQYITMVKKIKLYHREMDFFKLQG